MSEISKTFGCANRDQIDRMSQLSAEQRRLAQLQEDGVDAEQKQPAGTGE